MDYAIIATGGKQYKVRPGALLEVERMDLPQGKEVRLKEVLAVRNRSLFEVGRPILENASVLVRVVQQDKGPKVINFKFKRRKGYHRKVGHRQLLTRLQVLEIQLNGETLKEAGEPKVEPRPAPPTSQAAQPKAKPKPKAVQKKPQVPRREGSQAPRKGRK